MSTFAGHDSSCCDTSVAHLQHLLTESRGQVQVVQPSQIILTMERQTSDLAGLTFCMWPQANVQRIEQYDNYNGHQLHTQQMLSSATWHAETCNLQNHMDLALLSVIYQYMIHLMASIVSHTYKWWEGRGTYIDGCARHPQLYISWDDMHALQCKMHPPRCQWRVSTDIHAVSLTRRKHAHTHDFTCTTFMGDMAALQLFESVIVRALPQLSVNESQHL